MRRINALIAAAAMTAGLGVAAPSVASAATAQPHTAAAPVRSAAASSITWGTCTETDLAQAGAQCGLLSVPLNYSHPSGPKIEIAVSRILHTSSAADYRGIILTNPGGPGGSGLDLNTFLVAQLKADKLSAAAADYDWIGFDPRGVGSSLPALTCDPNYLGPDRGNYIPTTHKLLKYWKTLSKAYSAACAAKSAQQDALLKNDNTLDSARSMD